MTPDEFSALGSRWSDERKFYGSAFGGFCGGEEQPQKMQTLDDTEACFKRMSERKKRRG